jgi:hypothetical protein
MAKATKASAIKKAGSPKKALPLPEQKELESLFGELDAEDLAFLVAQARVLIHNRESAKAADEMRALMEARERGSRTGAKARGTAAAPSTDTGFDRIHIVRSASGNANLVLGGEFKLLTPGELAAIAKISIAGGSREARAERLFTWLDRERKDILIDGGMRSPASPHLVELLMYCEETFAKRKKNA